jgi:hypothetical protein
MSSSKIAQLFEELKDEIRRGGTRGRAPQDDGELRKKGKYSGRVSEILVVGPTPRRGKPQSGHDHPPARELEVLALAERIFGDEKKADAWLKRPNASLSGQVPFDLLKDELGAAVVRETLEQIDHGIFA